KTEGQRVQILEPYLFFEVRFVAGIGDAINKLVHGQYALYQSLLIKGIKMKEFRKLADKNRALISQRFFKTGEGQYGHGDKFLGITNPQVRSFARTVMELELEQIEVLL